MIIVVILLLAIFGIMLPPVDSTNKIAIFGGKKPSLLGKPLLSLSWLEHHFEPSVARGQLCQSFCVIDKFYMKHHQLVTIAKILSFLLLLRNGRMLWQPHHPIVQMRRLKDPTTFYNFGKAVWKYEAS